MSSSFDPLHPLMEDRQRLEKIADNAYATIQKVLFPWAPPRRRGGRSTDEALLAGSAVSADDVLAEAVIALLQYPPERLEGEWEALAVQIAHNKAVDALRASQKGLRGTDHREPLYLVSGDADRVGPSGETEPPLLEVLPSDWDGPEVESERVEKALMFRDLARTVLDERERKIVLAIGFEGYRRHEIGEELDLTSQRVGQIFREAVNRLTTHPKNPFQLHDERDGGDS